jgi:nucleoid DNA-binding protein
MLRDFKRPDLHAPRFRACSLQLLNKDFYKRVRKEHKELSGLSDAMMKRIVQDCAAVIQEQVVALRDGVELPEQLGFLFIGSTPATKGKNIDYKKSIELGKEVRHKNWDTDELTGKIFYTNYGTKYRFKYREVWKFVPVRQFKRVVAREYPKEFNKYVKVDSRVRVSVMFRKG